MSPVSRFAFGLALCCAVPALAHAQTPQPDVSSLVTPALMKNVREWLDTEMVRLSVETQNKRYGKLSQAEIEKLDKQWVAERESDDKPSLLVSDYNMSEMSGLDVARDALQTLAGLRVLIVSGYIEERVERAGRALGVRGFVHKPDLQEMCAAIDRLAASS